jgi:methylenetetrahydrofolate dehydrogenase (NADP+)/methenyltetrahydrofolate cyclohydrolase
MNIDPAKLMDGRSLAKRVRDETAAKVARIRAATGIVPCLATVLVGDDPASVTYTAMKRKRAEEIGMRSVAVELPLGTSNAEALARIRALGSDPSVHGILVQHPLPAPIDRRAAFEAIPAEKDVDGVTSAMLGRCVLGMPGFAACTPAGVMRLLAEYRVELTGAHAVVIGRSPILGKPMAAMLINGDATVTLCHSRTRALGDLVRQTDIVIAAVGKANFVQGDWIKPGAVVVDCGYNAGNVGDVDFERAALRARLITPVPGGVGPMTIAVLLAQSADAAAAQLGVE